MSKINFTYRKLTVALALVAIALLLNIHPATSTRSLARAAAADLTTEKQTLNSFADGLTSLEKKVTEFTLKTTITSTELNSVKTSASTLKTKVSQVQQTFQSVINKLKAAGEWENFDDVFLKRVTDPQTQALIRDAGGAKKILQDATSLLSGLSPEIDSLVQPLNSKVASTGFSFGNSRALGFMPVRASFIPPATVALKSARCYVQSAVYVVSGEDWRGYRANCTCNYATMSPSEKNACIPYGFSGQ